MDEYIQQAYWFKKICAFYIKSPAKLPQKYSFCLARRICAIVEEDKSKTFVKPKNIIKTSKISYCLKKRHKKSFTNTIERIKETYGKRTEERIPFFSIHNPNNPNMSPIIRQAFVNFQHSNKLCVKCFI